MISMLDKFLVLGALLAAPLSAVDLRHGRVPNYGHKRLSSFMARPSLVKGVRRADPPPPTAPGMATRTPAKPATAAPATPVELAPLPAEAASPPARSTALVTFSVD